MQEQFNELKNIVTKINNLLYGNPEKSDEISLVSKVNVIFNDISSIKKWFGGSLLIILSSCLFMGGQLKVIEQNSADIKDFMEHERSLEARVSTLEIIVKNLADGKVDIQRIGNIETVKVGK